MKLLFFDLETTGFGCDKCAIVQLGAIVVELDTENNLKPIDGINLIIYSTWVECSNNRYLVQYIINDNKVKEFFIFKLLFHGVIILCYLMLLRTIYFQIKGTSNRYERSIQKLYSNAN